MCCTLASRALTFSICRSVRYLPKWFPGAGFKRQAEELGKYTRAMAEEPFKFAKGAVVSSLATLVRATALIQS